MSGNRARILSVVKPTLAFVVFAVFFFPVYWMLITSFKSDVEIFKFPPTFFPMHPTLEGYQYQWKLAGKAPLYSYFVNSVLIAGSTVIVSVGLAAPSAYGLARFGMRVARYLLLLFLVTQMMPDVLFLAPLFMSFRALHLFDTRLAPVVVTCIHAIPFAVLCLRPYFLAIPRELEDAALIDGCGVLATFVRIMGPVAAPGLTVVSAFSFVFGWGNLIAPLTFLRTELKFPLTVTMFKAIGVYGIQWNMLMAYATMLALPVLVIFLLAQKRIVMGMTAGAVKG